MLRRLCGTGLVLIAIASSGCGGAAKDSLKIAFQIKTTEGNKTLVLDLTD